MTTVRLRMLIFSSLAVAASSIAAADPVRWTQPAYPTTPAQLKQLVTADQYTYREAKYDPKVTIESMPKGQWRWNTPEAAMISRVSAMMQQDYEAFMAAWDEPSRQGTVEHEQRIGRGKDAWLREWKDVFDVGRFVLTRRIETGEFVIITYQVVTFDGKDMANGLEMPVVFHKIGDRWLTTQALARDPLLQEYPWVSGSKEVERTAQ